MTDSGLQFLDSLHALAGAEKHDVLVELLRRVAYASPSDEDLTRIADLVFQRYDEHKFKA